MKTSQYIVLFAGIALPLFYLNCQGSFDSKGSGSLASQCIPRSQILGSNKVSHFKSQINGSKLLLSQNPFLASAQQKINQPLELGTPFTVLINPTCVRAFVDPGGIELPVSQAITKGKKLDLSVKYQSYPWTLSSQTELNTFEKQINIDPCVYAAGLNLNYELSASPTESIMNDPKIGQQSHLSALNFSEAYPIFYDDSNGVHNLRNTQRDIVVAVIDTGTAYSHGDLINNMWQDSDGHVGINATNLGVIGSEEDYDPYEVAPNSHGTHVSGIIAAEGNNQIGGSGIAPAGVKIMAVRIFNTKEGSTTEIISKTADVVAGILWAVDHGADVINLSLAKTVDGFGESAVRDEILELALKYALDNNVFLVFASGNAEGSSLAQELTDKNFSVLPARYGSEFAGAMTVGSINVDNFLRSSFSNFGSKYVEIAAPGQESETGLTSSNMGILSTASPVFINNVIEDQYARLFGTSMAAPMVSASAALVKGLIRQNKGIDPSVEEIERIIKESSLSYSHLSNDFEQGHALDLSRLAAKVVIDYDLDIPLGNLSQLVCP